MYIFVKVNIVTFFTLCKGNKCTKYVFDCALN